MKKIILTLTTIEEINGNLSCERISFPLPERFLKEVEEMKKKFEIYSRCSAGNDPKPSDSNIIGDKNEKKD